MANPPQDNFQLYFAEKLWEMIPGIYRHEDGLSENPGVLRALVEIMAEQAAILRRSHDRLWEDQFIELCQDWAVPYLADLVATRLVPALNTRGRRVDVAKTIYYRRRKGTPRVLEELASDIAGWEGKVVEAFKLLARARHGLDPFPAPLAGRFSGTPPGGFADLRSPRIAELAGSAFDEFFHTPDFRRHTGLDGRYNIPKLLFYLYRLRVYRLDGVTPFALADGLRFTFDPSGRGDIPLFMPRQRPENWDEWRSALEWELPAPIPCRLLGHAEYRISAALITRLQDDFGITDPVAAKLQPLRGFRFPSEARLLEILTLLNEPTLIAPAVWREIRSTALVADCGKAALLPAAMAVEEAPGTPVERVDMSAGDLSQWPVADPDKRVVIDPERGRMQFFGPPPQPGSTVSYHVGFSTGIGAGTFSRPDVEERDPDSVLQGGGQINAAVLLNDGVTQIDDNATYGPVADKLAVRNLTFQSANQRRPYLRLAGNWILNTPNNVEDSYLLLDGLWLGSSGNFEVILRGDYEEVQIRYATFDPGGENDAEGNPIRPVPLVIEGHVENLIIDHSIMSRIFTRNNGAVEQLQVADSILDATDAALPALQLPRGEVTMDRVTVFGQVDVNRLWASAVLVTGLVDVTDTQTGCFRFSAAPEGSRLPRPYEAHTLAGAAHIFTSRRFGQPGYAQLSQTAPVELVRGAENGAEMGAFNSLLNPIKLDSLRTKVDEYLPFGLIPIFIAVT